MKYSVGGNIIETFWAENQPQNSEDMNCLEIEAYGWFDWNCTATDVNVICQKDETKITSTATTTSTTTTTSTATSASTTSTTSTPFVVVHTY